MCDGTESAVVRTLAGVLTVDKGVERRWPSWRAQQEAGDNSGFCLEWVTRMDWYVGNGKMKGGGDSSLFFGWVRTVGNDIWHVSVRFSASALVVFKRRLMANSRVHA